MLMGAHAKRLARSKTQTFILSYSILFLLLHCIVSSYGSPESDALLKFKASFGNNTALKNWDASSDPCNGNRANWRGVLCLNGLIWGLQLEHMGLTGKVDVDALLALHSMRTLSLMNNQFDGPLPGIKKLGKLKALYLSNNKFSGKLPDDAFKGMLSLKRLFLSNNELGGTIPSSIATLPRLMELRLEGNKFQDKIPEFKQKHLKVVNLANNELQGPIPSSLSHMNSASFSGNKGLCGAPLAECSPNTPSSSATPTSPNKKINIWIIVAVILIVAVVIVLAMFLFLYCGRRSSKIDAATENSNKIMSSYGSEQSELEIGQSKTRRMDNFRLSFLGDNIEKFDLQELLRASAEVLGSGTFGASYKAIVSNGQAVVVKRYRHMNNVSREEFHEHMRRIGRLKHPNLHPLGAYYYRKEEKLLVSTFVKHGSLATHLHGNHSQEKQGLDWSTRLKIIKGVAKGLAYLYKELPIIVPHGHLKSSNVLLDEEFVPLLADYALRPVINPDNAHQLMMAYKSPEYTETGRTSNKTDVWCFGIVILETLTGKFPENYLTLGYEAKHDLANWVNNMVMEKKSSEVFDKEMTGTKNIKAEMINVLKIGLSCCEQDVDRRPDIKDVVKRIEEIDEGNSDEDDKENERRSVSVVQNVDDVTESSPESG